MLAAIPQGALTVGLDMDGRPWSTRDLASRLEDWTQQGDHVCFMVGGPDGMSADCLAQLRWRWSLSALTLPHHLVKVVLLEQLYRAWSLLQGLPYHRD